MDSEKHAGLQALELKLKKDLALVLDQEEIMWFQKSREHWIIDGDRNTAFFHASAVLKGSKKHISRLKDSNSSWVSDQRRLLHMAMEFYQNLYTVDSIVAGLASLPPGFPVISFSDLEFISNPFTAKEVKSASWDMDSYKAPGPDGFQAVFFQKSWAILGADLINMALSFLNGGALPVGACDILITLLPKVEVLESISQFRPVSLCNMSFKEIAHSMHHCSGQKGWMAIKVDLEKAYDRRRWELLLAIMQEVGFPKLWQNLIFNEAVSSNAWHLFMHSRRGPAISHLFFADDLLLFVEASLDQMRVIMDCLNLFCSTSGQHVNVAKSSVWFSSNADVDLQQNISKVVKASFDVLLSRLEEQLAGWKIRYLSLGNVGDHHRVPIVKWETVTKPMDQGGLGVRTCRIMNDAFLMKLGWKLLSDDGALWCSVLRNKYMAGLHGLNHMVSRTTSSNLWKGILYSVEALRAGSFRVVVSGMFTDFWNDDWVGIGPLFQNAQTVVPNHLLSLSVSHFWDFNGRRWELIRPYLDEQICLMIEAVHLQSNVQSMDVYARKATPNDCFSVKSAYRSIGGFVSAAANSKCVMEC
ncbi:uncharacterized protein LOC131178309 [Hevea brasiliensis]|uniref:uncharacterized protein LOC131178309 n=1 Tax=Hevea brasiliensis TaxID=3981 RepID=UPI0025D683B7|nr:uncharacterized protein LOC131178309 [Hevea brasiliensis]